MGAGLVKHRSVLDKVPYSPMPEADYVLFDNYAELGNESLGISRQMWKDMGRPSELTITVEPGDKLNEGK